MLIPDIILVSIMPINWWRLRHVVAAKQMVIKSGDHDDHDDYDQWFFIIPHSRSVRLLGNAAQSFINTVFKMMLEMTMMTGKTM